MTMRQQGFDGYYDSRTDEGMSGFTFMGDNAQDCVAGDAAACLAVDAAAKAAAAAAAVAPALPSTPGQPPPAQAPVTAEDHTLRNVGIGAGALVLLYAGYRYFKH